MSSYLLPAHTGPLPFTASDICEQLGVSLVHESEVSVYVAMICNLQHARSETYAVTVSPRFEEETTWPGGRKPVEVGPAYELDGKTVRDCRYEPTAERIAAARAAVVRKCSTNGSRVLAIAIADTARERTRLALHGSLAIAAVNAAGLL